MSLDSSGRQAALLLASQAFGRPAQLLVLALRDTAILIGKQLAAEGIAGKWRLHVAHSVATASQRMNETNFDLVLVDLDIEEVRMHVTDIVAAAGATLVYGLCADEHGEIAMTARRDGIADVLSSHHLQGPSTARIMRLMLESARTASNSRLLAAAVEGAPVAYAMTDALQPDMPLVYVNEHFVTLTGYLPAEVIGRNCRFLQGPDTDSRDVDRIREAIRHAQPLYIELINYRKDGQPFWNGMLLRPIRAANGTVTHFVATLRDMSERRRTEESLERSARLHRLLVQASGGTTIFAGADGQLRAPLPEFEAFTGLRYHEYRSGDWSAAVHPDDRARYTEVRAQALRDPNDHICTFRLWHAPTSAWRYVELRLLPLRDATELLTEWVGTLTDVNDRRVNEQMLAQSRDFLATALETLPMLIMYVDREGLVRWLNQRCADWLGRSSDQLQGASFVELAVDSNRAQVMTRVQAVLAGQALRYSEEVTLRSRTAMLDVAYFPHQRGSRESGALRIEGFYWVGSDPSEQQRLLEETQRFLALSEK